MTVTTALTAQNTQGVTDIHYTPSDFVRKQIDACISDIGVDVVKTGMFSPITCALLAVIIQWWLNLILYSASNSGKGMLASAETVKVVAESLRQHNVNKLVLDPVINYLFYYMLQLLN